MAAAAAAAAAAFSRSRGVSGVRTTKGLILLFTLLCLVCITSSRMDKDELENIKDNLQKLQREAERKKADHMLDSEFTSEILGDAARLLSPTISILKHTLPDFTPLLELMKDTKSFLEDSKTYLDKVNEDKRAEIEDYKQSLEFLKRLLTDIEKKHVEL